MKVRDKRQIAEIEHGLGSNSLVVEARQEIAEQHGLFPREALIDAMRFGGAVACKSGDPRPRHQSRDVLRAGAAPHAVAQIIGDAIGDEFEWQLAALDLAVETDDVKTIAGDDRLLGRGPRREREQRALKIRRHMSRADLPEIALAPPTDRRNAGGPIRRIAPHERAVC